MAPYKISLQLRTLQQPFKKALEIAHRLGVQAIEVDARNEVRPSDLSQTGLRQLRKQLDDFRMTVSSVTFQTRRGYQVETDLEARVEATKAAMDLAYKLGTNLVINQIGEIPADVDSREWSRLLAVLLDLGNYSNKAGAWLCARTGTESGADLKRLLDALPQGALAVALDPAQLVVNKFSPLEVIEQVGASIWHVYAKDAVRDAARGRGMEVPLGRGSVDFPELLAGLEEREYRGYLTVERESTNDPIGEAEQAIKFLQNVQS